MNFLSKKNLIISIIFSSFFFIGLLTYKDYGIGIDDKFHRLNGFFWLNYLLETFNFNQYLEITNLKLENIEDYTLPSINQFNFYSILFDVPAAILEILFNLDDTQDYYFLRHFLNFFYFFLGSIFFYKILKNRFDFFSCIIGTLFFILSPRIYGDSFYNMKDIIFLTFLTISIFYCFEFMRLKNLKNLIFFSLFTSFCIQTRMIGIFIPIFFIFFYFLSILTNKNDLKYIFVNCGYVFFVVVFLYIFWPYLWNDPIKKFLILFTNVESLIPSIKMLFKGNYINVKYMPYDYLFTWIIITSPIPHLLIFFTGLILISKRFIKRLINFENNKLNNYDLWRGYQEKKDLFIFTCLISIIFFITIFNIGLVNSWKYLYFLNIFIIYIGTFGIYILNRTFKKKKLFRLSVIIALIFVSFRIVQYHPFQGLYFNYFLTMKYKNNFDIDFTAIGGRKALEWVINDNNEKGPIKIASASWTPLNRSVEILDKKIRSKIVFIGQDYKNANYIYTNNISEVDKSKSNKYVIPYNFKKIYEYYVDELVIFTIYKNKL